MYDRLSALGVRFVPQDGSGINPQTSALVVSTAVESDNPDVKKALDLGVPLVHRSEMLSACMDSSQSVAVTGTSGKSTVTGMIAWILEGAGRKPVMINGGCVTNWRQETAPGNFYCSLESPADGFWVVEADESDRSLMNLYPDWVLVTNASRDHFEIEDTLDMFRHFAGRAREGSINLADDSLPLDGFSPELSAEGGGFMVDGVEFRIRMPGFHNAVNALSAALICREMGVGLDAAAHALESFEGIHRRLETVLDVAGIRVIDDYAHNPAKIKAAWNAVAPYHKRVVAVWQAHGFTPLASMLEELASVFGELAEAPNMLILPPVYYVGGTAGKTVSASDLAAKAQSLGATVETAATRELAIKTASRLAEPGDAILIMGARDPELPRMARTAAGLITARLRSR